MIGKWLSEDPIGFAAGDTNISRYVTNRVLSRVDSNRLTEVGLSGIETTEGAGGQEQDSRYIIGYQKDANGNRVAIYRTGDRTFYIHVERGIGSWPVEVTSLSSNFERYVFDVAIHETKKGTKNGYIGTPTKPHGDGRHIAVFGAGENPDFEDFSTNKDFQKHDGQHQITGRPFGNRELTSDLEDGSASHVIIRSSPRYPQVINEVYRILGPNSAFTYTGSEQVAFDLFHAKWGIYGVATKPPVKVGDNWSVTFGFFEKPLGCSPKVDPDVMRVSEA